MSSPRQHTPGPWVFVVDGEMDNDCNTPRIPVPFDFSGPGYYNNPSIEGPNGETIAGCGEYLIFGPHGNKEVRAANVALLCSATDLLAALEDILALYESAGVQRYPEARREVVAARAAIAKATGGAA